MGGVDPTSEAEPLVRHDDGLAEGAPTARLVAIHRWFGRRDHRFRSAGCCAGRRGRDQRRGLAPSRPGCDAHDLTSLIQSAEALAPLPSISTRSARRQMIHGTHVKPQGRPLLWVAVLRRLLEVPIPAEGIEAVVDAGDRPWEHPGGGHPFPPRPRLLPRLRGCERSE